MLKTKLSLNFVQRADSSMYNSKKVLKVFIIDDTKTQLKQSIESITL